MSHSSAPRHRRLRAPEDDGAALVEPPFRDVANTLKENRRLIDVRGSHDICGYSLCELRREARTHTFHQALEYTRAYSNVWQELDEDSPWFVSGHQPQLFHSGVWFKNFALDSLRRQHNGVSIHLLIDNDLCHTASIRVPAGPVSAPAMHSVPYDQSAAGISFEERQLTDRDLFDSFGLRITRVIADLIPDPIVASAWSLALEAANSDRNLGRILSKMRHLVEIDWGRCNLEVPLSLVCGSRSFAIFVYGLLLRHTEFRSAYNELLREYRIINRIRSRSHPVPELTEIDGWHEMPFWVWHASDPIRRPMFVHVDESTVSISDRIREWKIRRSSPLDTQINDLEGISGDGVRIRPRALTTTMFVRLFVADLFLHGIGGSKYDELTDAIIKRFWGFQAPEYMTVTATIRLPVKWDGPNLPSPSEIRQRIRESYYHPDRFLAAEVLTDGNQVSNWLKAKENALISDAVSLPRRERHRIIQEANAGLRPFVEKKRGQLHDLLRNSLEMTRVNSILRSREYSFCLFPIEYVRSIIERNLQGETEQEN